MVNVDSGASRDEILAPSADKDVVLVSMATTSRWSKESRYSVNCFLSLLDLYILIKRERERSVNERVCASLSKAVELEVPDLEDGYVVIVELGHR